MAVTPTHHVTSVTAASPYKGLECPVISTDRALCVGVRCAVTRHVLHRAGHRLPELIRIRELSGEAQSKYAHACIYGISRSYLPHLRAIRAVDVSWQRNCYVQLLNHTPPIAKQHL